MAFDLKEYQKNVTPEQRAKIVAKAKATRKKNRVEKQLVADNVKKVLTEKFKVLDVKTNKVKITQPVNVIVRNLAIAAMNPETDPKVQMEILTFFRDSIGEKPTEKQKVDMSFSYDEFVKKNSGNIEF